MFSKKPHPPHCEDLKRSDVKLVQKILSEKRYLVFEGHMKAALEEGLTDVLVAVAKNFAQLPVAHQEDFCEDVAFYSHDITIAAEVIPQIVGLNEKNHSGFLAYVLSYPLTPAMRQKIVAMPLSSSLRALTAIAMMRQGRAVTDEHILMLLMPPADIHYDVGMVMKIALLNNRFQVAYALRGLGFDLADYAPAIEKFLLRNNGSEQAHRYLTPFLPLVKTAASIPVAAPPVVVLAPTPPPDEYSRKGDTVSRVTMLPNNNKLNVVFNFARAEKVVFAQVGENVSAPTVIDFHDIGDRAHLKEAAQAYVSQGGDEHQVAHLLAYRPLSLKPKRGA